MTAQSSGRISQTRRWALLMFWYLRRAYDAYTGNRVRCKEKKPSDWLQIGRLAVRMTVPLVSRCRALGEAAHDGNYLV